MQQILLEEQPGFPEFIGNSLGRPSSSGASSDSIFSQFQMPAIVVTPVESPDDTASLQNSTDAASLVLLYTHETMYHLKFHFNNHPDTLMIQIFHPDSALKLSSNLHETYQCRMYSRKLLMMGREDA